ncbi:MAG: AmmeMemoRadiSam system protein A [Syntrophomonadaceae bacterium]|nr:AmmeMemoRadiSam system protein A [Syntrophomonadaceae bacterium]
MLTYAALSPHPPLIIPDIGGERLKDVADTVRGMKQMAAELAASKPDTVVFLTPHGNVFGDAISILSEPLLEGSLASFGSNMKWTGIANDLPLVREITDKAIDSGINILWVDRENAARHRLNPHLDHGIMVPWYYLLEAGLDNIPIVAISIGFLPQVELYTLGCIISAAADKLHKKIAVVASGDMSHRLKDEGPYDYHPDGPVYDQLISRLLQENDFEAIINLPEELRENAGECGYRSIVIMLGCLDKLQVKTEVFSYEGTFGVGYLTIGITAQGRRDSLLEKLKTSQLQQLEETRQGESLPVKWARLTLENYIKQGRLPELPSEYKQLRDSSAGVFVSLKKHGQLRGCIGTIEAVYDDIAAEIQANAISAATRDPRFSEVQADELEQLVYSVDILGKAEPCSREDLDPVQYGVIVSRGSRRGLLLPALEGVNTVDEQLNIALQKAGIRPGEDYDIQRFKVTRYS